MLILAATTSPAWMSVLLGAAMLVVGVALVFYHKFDFDRVLASKATKRIIVFEHRKYYRRAMVGSMVASAGIVLATLNWITDARVYVVLLTVLLLLILGVLLLAVVDMFSISLNHIAKKDEESEKAALEALLRQREEKKKRAQDSGLTLTDEEDL